MISLRTSTLWYVAPTPVETVEMTIPVEFNNLLDEGAFQLHNANTSDDMIVSFTPLTYELEGTFVNDGMFGRLGAEGGQYDFLDDYTYVATWNAATSKYEMHSVSKGTMTVTVGANDDLTAVVDVVCSNAVRYLLTLTGSTYEPKIDENYTPVDRTYTTDDLIQFDDKSATKGQIYCKIYEAYMEDMTYLLFFVDEADADIVIPEGVYPINGSGQAGTVYANPGIEDNNVYPSLYVTITSDGYLQAPLWLITQGTVTVSKTTDGKLYMELDAANDYGTPIHIVYNGSLVESGVEQVVAEQVVAKKILNNGQLLIIHDNGDVFDATGARVK